MTAEKRPAFCSEVQQLSSGLGMAFFGGNGAGAVLATGVSTVGVSISMASSSRLGVAVAAALDRPLFLGGIALTAYS